MKTNKILGILAILGFFSSASFAEDFLAKLTNGAVSDTSEGVRVLSAEEEREVVGGFRYLGSNYGYTYVYMPLKNNYNANTRPQTNNQKILSNSFMNNYKPPRIKFSKP